MRRPGGEGRRFGGKSGAALAALLLAAICLAAIASCRGRGGEETAQVRATDPYGRELPTAGAGGAGTVLPASTAGAALAGPPPAESFGDDALLYRIGESPCAVLRAGLDGVAAGLCGEELQPRVYLRPDRPLRLAELIARYAPFELEVGDEEVELHGRGTQEAGPVERRLVLEWARRLMAESRGVTATRGFRLGFEWQRQLQGGRDCDALAVYLSGEALATTCDGLRATGQVPPEQMAPILAWHDRLRPFQVVRQGGAAGEPVSDRLIFPGAGDAAQDDETVRTMAALAATLHSDVLERQLAVQQAEEAREAELEAARIAAREEAEAEAERARGWVPEFAREDEADMTLSESIAVGADPEAVREAAPSLVPGGEDDEEESDEEESDAAGDDGGGATATPQPAEPEPDGDPGDGDDGA